MFYLRNYRNPILSFRINMKLATLAAIVAFSSGNISAQTSADGTIHGRITDTSGAALVGVNIVAHSSAVGGSFKAESDSEGNYRLTDLPPGTDYVVEASTANFEKFVRSIGQIWTPWLIQWNTLVGREFRITDRQTVEADLNIYNLTNNGAGQQFVNGNNAASATFGQLQNVQPPRSAQISLRYHF